MHKSSTNKPTQAQLLLPLIDTLQEMGGRAKAKDVANALADRFDLAPEVRDETSRSADGQVSNVWQRHVRFAKLKAQTFGYLRSDGGGRWRITDEGQQGLTSVSPAVVVTVLTDERGVPVSAQIDVSAGLPTIHTLHHGDARSMSWIPDGEIPLVVTSCPYFDIKRYESAPGQLAEMPSYDAFLDGLDEVWRECWRVMQPGGRMCINVGDVLRSRKQHGTHHVLPLHADILVRARRMGFLTLNSIIWSKLGNCSYEEGGAGVLGKPGMPNQVIKLENEHILMLRRPGPYRSPTPEQAELSRIGKEEHRAWFRQIWSDVPGARATPEHPAPFPVEVPYRLIRMFSFAGDTVLDPFCGSAQTIRAAMKAGRNSVGVEVAQGYMASSIPKLAQYAEGLAA